MSNMFVCLSLLTILSHPLVAMQTCLPAEPPPPYTMSNEAIPSQPDAMCNIVFGGVESSSARSQIAYNVSSVSTDGTPAVPHVYPSLLAGELNIDDSDSNWSSDLEDLTGAMGGANI